MGTRCLVALLENSCNYDPASPAISYFGIGDAVAALALTLAVRTFLKPLYVLRLSVRKLGILHIYGLCFAGFIFAIVAAALPSLPVPRTTFLSLPIFWELLGGIAFLLAYATLALGSTIPIRLKDGNFEKFARNLAEFLSENKEPEYIAAANDILINIPKLIEKSQFIEDRWSGTSAFFEFRYQKEIREASYAGSILRILSDEAVCSAIVNGTPWRLARVFNRIEEDRLHSRSAEPLIKELAHQAIKSPSSPMRREYGYTGFGEARVLTDAIFGSLYVCQNYRPFDMLSLRRDLDAGTVQCLSLAMETSVQTAIRNDQHWQVWFLYDLEDVLRDVMGDLSRKDIPHKYELYGPLVNALEHMIRECREFLSRHEHSDDFFCTDENARKFDVSQNHVINACASVVFKFLQSISNDFEGPGGRYWISAYGVWENVFPTFGTYPDGADPFQQHLAIMLLKNTRQNLDGLFPAITRLLLSLIGPYRERYPKNRNSAAGMLENSFYREMRYFRNVRESHYLKKEFLLPPHITFDEENNTFSFHYKGSPDRVTELSLIRPPKVHWIPNA